MTSPVHRLQAALGHRFHDAELLTEALTHRSWAHEHGGEHNERLEFLGDSVLNAATTVLLVERFPMHREGALSQLRARLVNTATLAEIGEDLGLGQCLRLGRGEESSGGRTKTKLLANTTEAVLGALYLDTHRHGQGAFELCATLVGVWLTARIDGLEEGADEREGGWKDARNILQEYTQREWGDMPTYSQTLVLGPDHAKTFRFEVCMGERVLGRGEGTTKQEARQAAARDALIRLQTA